MAWLWLRALGGLPAALALAWWWSALPGGLAGGPLGAGLRPGGALRLARPGTLVALARLVVRALLGRARRGPQTNEVERKGLDRWKLYYRKASWLTSCRGTQ